MSNYKKTKPWKTRFNNGSQNLWERLIFDSCKSACELMHYWLLQKKWSKTIFKSIWFVERKNRRWECLNSVWHFIIHLQLVRSCFLLLDCSCWALLSLVTCNLAKKGRSSNWPYEHKAKVSELSLQYQSYISLEILSRTLARLRHRKRSLHIELHRLVRYRMLRSWCIWRVLFG